MRLIGYWMPDLRDTRLPLPQELVGDLPESVRDGICSYLAAGDTFATYRGYSWCRFRCGAAGSEMGSREFTDGEWVWPEGLVHYVRDHGVVLPEEFISTAVSGQRIDKSYGQGTASLEFWIDWSATRRLPRIRQKLAVALAAARDAETALMERLVAGVLQREIEGSDPCAFAGCGRPALIGRQICARHSIDDQLLSQTVMLYRLPALDVLGKASCSDQFPMTLRR